MTETTTAQQPKVRRGDLVLVELRPSYTVINGDKRGRVEDLAYRLMVVTNLYRDGRIKMVASATTSGAAYPQQFDKLLYRTGPYWLLPAAEFDVDAARRFAREHVYPNSTTPRDFPSLEAAREALAPARRGYVAPVPGIPQPTPAREHVRCNHGLNDAAGYVVAYSHVDGNEVTFTDIEYVDGPTNYGRALELVREAREKVRAGEVFAVYAVIHHVYADGHRPV